MQQTLSNSMEKHKLRDQRLKIYDFKFTLNWLHIIIMDDTCKMDREFWLRIKCNSCIS